MTKSAHTQIYDAAGAGDMRALGRNDRIESDGGDGDILGEVSLTSFRAAPSTIGPFGASLLSWSVAGPAGSRWHVALDYTTVPKSGQFVVQPTSTQTYQLTAHSGHWRKPLGSVQVVVDRTTCEAWPIYPRSTLERGIRATIKQMPDYFLKPPLRQGDEPLIVSFSEGRIHVYLHVGVRRLPVSASARIRASFGVAIEGNTLIPVNEQIDIAIGVPLWLRLFGSFPLAIRLDMEKDSAEKKIHAMIQDLGRLLTANATPTPAGKRLNTVRVYVDDRGVGVIALTACSDAMLTRFAELSADDVSTRERTELPD